MSLPRYIAFTIDTRSELLKDLSGDALRDKIGEILQRTAHRVIAGRLPLDGENVQMLHMSALDGYMTYLDERPLGCHCRPDETPTDG